MSVVITGNPGVGKHTLAKKIVKLRNLKLLDINKIAKNSGLYEKKDGSFDVDVRKLKNVMKKTVTKKSLIVGHLAPYVVPKNKVKVAIVLRKNPYKLISVYQKRKYSAAQAAENLGSEILGVILYDSMKSFGKKKTFQIDTTNKSITKLTKDIKDIINGKFENENVDWLTLVSENDDLKKFFQY